MTHSKETFTPTMHVRMLHHQPLGSASRAAQTHPVGPGSLMFLWDGEKTSDLRCSQDPLANPNVSYRSDEPYLELYLWEVCKKYEKILTLDKRSMQIQNHLNSYQKQFSVLGKQCPLREPKSQASYHFTVKILTN